MSKLRSFKTDIVLALLVLLALVTMPSKVFAIQAADIVDLDAKIQEMLAQKKYLEYGGFIKVRYHLSNYEVFSWGQTLPPDKSVPGDDNTAQFMEQRARLYLLPRFSENVFATIAFELDARWGDAAYVVGRNSGGGLETDALSIETKSVNMTVKYPGTDLFSTFGLQTIKDPYNGILFGWADAAGVTLTNKFSDKVTGLLGYYRFWQPLATLKKTSSVDFVRAEVSLPKAAKDFNLGLNLQVLVDKSGEDGPGVLGGPAGGGTSNGFAPFSYNRSTGRESLLGNNKYNLTLWLPGVNFDYKIGQFVLSGFFIYEGGSFTSKEAAISDVTISSFAANLKANTKVGSVNLELNGLYVTGDDSGPNPGIGIKKKGFYTPGSYSGAAAWMGQTRMKLIFPDLDTASQDQYLVYDVTNTFEQNPLGVGAVMLTADTMLSKTIQFEAGIGALWSSKDRPVNGESYMATEINAGLYYKPYKVFSLGVMGTHAFIGDFYKISDAQAAAYNAAKPAGANNITPNRDPADMWRITARATYSF